MQMPESVSAAITLITSTIFPFALRAGYELEQPRAHQAHAAAALGGGRNFYLFFAHSKSIISHRNILPSV